ncbi:MAG: hypothetical protein WAV93_09405 [Bacteroidales bacterium]
MQLNDEIKKKNPFKVPEGYFDTLTERTMSAIRQSRDQDEGVWETVMPGMAEGAKDGTAGTESGRPVRRIRFMPLLGLAAAILGFALLATVMIRIVTGDRAPAGFEEGNSLYADLAAEELDTYMIENELFMTEPGDISLTEQTIASDAIIDYLMTEDIDLDDIYELL